MRKDKVSIIVPVYNAGSLLERCLDSIASQTYSNIEVILIDDGSTDGSGDICDKYSKRDNRFVVKHQNNSGVAAAYNKGLDSISGDFIIIVDNDDFLDSGLVSQLMINQAKTGADYVQGGYCFVNEEGKAIKKVLYGDNIYNESRKMIWDYLITGRISYTMTGALIKSCLFEGIRFPEKAISGDVQVIPQLLHRCKLYQQVNSVFYYVTMKLNSVSRSTASDLMYWDKHACTSFYERFISEYYNDLMDFLLYRKTSVAVLLYTKTTYNEKITEVKNKKEQCIKEFKENYVQLKKSYIYYCLPRKERIKYRIFNFCPNLLCLLVKIYTRLMIEA